MTQKHTKSPWNAHKVKHTGAHNDYYQITSNGGVIAVLHDKFNEHTSIIEPQEANARLIAAAPDLLEALEKLIAHDDLLRATNEINYLPNSARAAELNQARAAIAKAEKQP